MGLDAVELIIDIEETFGISIPDGAAAKMQTPSDLIHYIQKATHSSPLRRPCISLRAFHRVRSALRKTTKIGTSKISLNTKTKHLFPSSTRHRFWSPFRYSTVSNLVFHEIRKQATILTLHQNWTQQEVRQVTRMIITHHTNQRHFADTDQLVQDLGLD